MKSLLLPAFLCLQSLAYSQITFEQINSPVDFSISAVRKSPTGEYFVQAANDDSSIYTSMNGEDWTKSPLPVSGNLNIYNMEFFNDGTPVIKSSNNLIRRNDIWYTMKLSGSSHNVRNSFVKEDSLFVYEDKTFAYSLDKGETFTTIFTYGKNIGNVYLWKFEHHFVLYHTGGVKDSLTVFTQDGVPVFSVPILLSITKITYNSCGKVLFYDRDHYFLLEDQGLNFTYGVTTDIIPGYSDDSDLLSQDGHYYHWVGNTIYKSTGCNFTWDTLVCDELISRRGVWIGFQDQVFPNPSLRDFFIESNGINLWEKHSVNMDAPYVYNVLESGHEHQIAKTPNALFSKMISDLYWLELDSTGFSEIQYSPNGDFYVRKDSYILYSTDNGISFHVISIPEVQMPVTYYGMRVLDNNIIFLTQEGIGDSYYTLNNGQDWIPVISMPYAKYSQIKLVDDYIIIADLKINYAVTRINIVTNERTSEDLGEFSETAIYSSVIEDDGTIYLNAHNVTTGQSGLHRYRFGQQLEFLGEFQELENAKLYAAGAELYGFGQEEYYLFDGDKLTTHSYFGLPDNNYTPFFLSENKYLFAIQDNYKIFRSTEPLSYGQFINGSVYNQVNQDCALDSSNATLQYWQVKIEGDDYLRMKTSDSEGKFNFAVPDGQYKLSSHPVNSNWDLCESTFNITIDSNHTNVKQDFLAKGFTECAELELDFSTPLLRRCLDNYYFVQVRNTGPQASEGTTLTLELDPYCDLISATIPYIQLNDSILEFDLGVLTVNDNISFQIFFNLSCNAPLGKEHCLKGSLSDDNDCGHSRSNYTECQQNIGSYDPNDKRIFNEDGKETETVDKNEYIYYHIRFQNTGTDIAFKIRVVDPLSPKLDLGTLEMLSASHPYNYSITDGPSLAVNFENILLPDSSTNEPASHGFFKFRIKPLPEYDYGTNISNQAGIYFDFNDPVLTNETTLLIQPRVATKEANEFIKFNIYPNPADNELTLDISEADLNRIEAYEIINYLGQIVNQSVFLSSNVINIDHLAPGIYNLNLIENNIVIGMKKFVKL